MEDPKDEMEVIGPALEGTRNVLEACAKTKGEVKRVVLTSSCAAIIGKSVVVLSLRKTADILQRREMTSEKRARKFHTDDASLLRSG